MKRSRLEMPASRTSSRFTSSFSMIAAILLRLRRLNSVSIMSFALNAKSL